MESIHRSFSVCAHVPTAEWASRNKKYTTMYLDVLFSKEWRTVKRCLLRTGHQVPGHGFFLSARRQSTVSSCVGPHSPLLAPPPPLPIPLGVTSYYFALTHDHAYVPMFPRSINSKIHPRQLSFDHPPFLLHNSISYGPSNSHTSPLPARSRPGSRQGALYSRRMRVPAILVR